VSDRYSSSCPLSPEILNKNKPVYFKKKKKKKSGKKGLGEKGKPEKEEMEG